MMGWYYAGTSGYSWGWILLLLSGLTAALCIGTWALVRLTRADDIGAGRAVETPRQLLDRRLAASEIGTED